MSPFDESHGERVPLFRVWPLHRLDRVVIGGLLVLLVLKHLVLTVAVSYELWAVAGMLWLAAGAAVLVLYLFPWPRSVAGMAISLSILIVGLHWPGFPIQALPT